MNRLVNMKWWKNIEVVGDGKNRKLTEYEVQYAVILKRIGWDEIQKFEREKGRMRADIWIRRY